MVQVVALRLTVLDALQTYEHSNDSIAWVAYECIHAYCTKICHEDIENSSKKKHMHTYIYHICINNPSKRDSCTAPNMVSQSQETRQGAILCEAPNWFKRIQTGGIWRCHLEAAGQGLTLSLYLWDVVYLWTPPGPEESTESRPINIQNYSILFIQYDPRLQEISDYARCLCRPSVDSSALQSFAATCCIANENASQMHRDPSFGAM